MARLRLLAAAITLVLAASLASCARCYGSRQVEVPRLAGQILDTRTGKPIEGIAVYQMYATFNRMMAGTHQTVGERDHRWTVTDADGRFEFPAHVVAEALKNYVEIDGTPAIRLFHRDYGGPLVSVPEDRTQWESIVWEIEPDARTLRDFETDCTSACRDLEGDAYADCCSRACGDDPICRWTDAR